MKRNSIFALLAVLLMAVIAFFFFFPDNIEGRSLQQSDMMQGLANGHETQQVKAETGETPRWTDALFGGMPTFQISPSYPASDALSVASSIYTLGLPSPSNLLFGIMLGFFILCLCCGAKWYTALLGAIGWGFSSYFIIIIGAGHIWKFLTLMYIPPTIGGIVLCYKGRFLAGTALAALFGALQLMSNHVQMSYYFIFVIIAMIVAFAIKALKKKEMKRFGIATACVLAAGILGICANAPSLYSTYEYSKETVRGKSTELTPTDGSKANASGVDIDYITQWSYGIDETLSLLIPNVKGGATIKPMEGSNALLSVAETSKAEKLYYSGDVSADEYTYSQNFPQYFGDQPMTNGPVYVGAFLLMLAVLALFICDGPMVWCLFAVSILAILLSWGHNLLSLTQLFVDVVPMYSKFRTPSSILVIVEFTVPLMAVMALHKIITTQNFLSKYGLQFNAIMGAGAFICLLVWMFPSLLGSPFSENEIQQLNEAGLFANPQFAGVLRVVRESRLALVSADALRSLIFIICGSAILWLYFKRTIPKAWMMVSCLSVLVLIDLYSLDKRYVDTENFVTPSSEEVFRPTAADLQILKDKSHYRVVDLNDFSGARSSYFHKTVGGYHAAKLTRYNDLLDRQLNNLNEGVLNMLNAKYIIKDDTVITNPDALGAAWFVSGVKTAENADAEMKILTDLPTDSFAVADRKFASLLASGKAPEKGDTISLKSYRPDRLVYEYTAKGPRTAVFSEIYFPWGWTATIDGKKADIARVDYVLRALAVPAGKHTVEFVFDPESVKVTNGIAVASVSIIYILCALALGIAIWQEVRRRKADCESNVAD